MGSKNLDGNLVKKANVTQRWTEQDIEQLLKCQDPNTGPAFFLNNFFYIQHPVQGKLQYQAYEYQSKLLESYHTHRFSVNMLGRQMGKCLTNDINIRILNKTSGETYEIPIGKLYEYELAKREGKPLPDISQYKKEV
jgi:hypothetical protein